MSTFFLDDLGQFDFGHLAQIVDLVCVSAVVVCVSAVVVCVCCGCVSAVVMCVCCGCVSAVVVCLLTRYEYTVRCIEKHARLGFETSGSQRGVSCKKLSET